MYTRKSGFGKFKDKIESGENFAYSSYADEEVSLIKGENSQVSDKVGKKLLEALLYGGDKYYYGISSEGEGLNYLMGQIKGNKDNIYIDDSNNISDEEFCSSFDKSAYVICDRFAASDSFPFEINKLIPLPNNFEQSWEDKGDDYEQILKEYVSTLNNETFFVAAGPISKILIHKMHEANPNNQYIDVGSAMDEYVYESRSLLAA
jgi:hypothetical protein